MEHVVFDGIDLSSVTKGIIALAGDRPIASVEARTENVNGRDGYVFMGADLKPQPVEFHVIMVNKGITARRRAVRALAPILLVKKPVTLAFSSDEGLYYVGMPSKAPDLKELVVSGSMKVVFQPLDAAMYGETHSVTVPSGGSASIVVGGTYPTHPKVSVASAVRDQSSLVWGLRLDDGDFLHVETGSDSGRAVLADCEGRTLTVNGSVELPTLDSNWFMLAQGVHTLRNDQGSGECVVTWTERWL